MDGNPLVTVITTFLNEERFLNDTITSVMNQTFTNWEYLLVDDGSTDRSTTIAKEYANNSNGQIIYLEHEGHANKGISASRNAGIAKARGTWIALLDGDDLWMPVKLQEQLAILTKNPQVSMLCEASYYFGKGHDPALENVVLHVGAQQDRIFYPPELALKLHPLGKGNAPCVGSLIVRTDVARRLGNFEESFGGKYAIYEDQGFLMKVYLNEIVFISSNCNNLYRQHPDSTLHSSILTGQYAEGRHFFLRWLRSYLSRHQVKHPAVRRLLKKRIWRYEHPLAFAVLKSIYRNCIGGIDFFKRKLKQL